MKPTLVKLNQSHLMDIPEMLRDLADDIQAGVVKTDHALVVLETPEGELNIRGYGKVQDRARETGILFKAAMQL